MTMAPIDIHSLTGAYALNALDEAEREQFELHLAECDVCRTEVLELGETVARLADDSWSVPPPRLKASVMGAIRQTRQTSPLRSRRKLGLKWRHRTTMLVAAGLLALVAAGGVIVTQQMRINDARNERVAMEQVLTAPDAQYRSTGLTGGGQLSMVMSPGRDAAVVILNAAAAPGTGKAYQLWLMKGGQPVSAGVFSDDEASAAKVLGGVVGKDMLAVTIEPAGGSQLPTSDIVAKIPLS